MGGANQRRKRQTSKAKQRQCNAMREPKHSQWIPPSQREKENKTHQSKAMIRKPKVQWETRRRINNARFHRKDVRLIALEGDPLLSSCCISQNFLDLPTVEKVMLSRDNEDPLGPSVCSLQRLSLGSLAETLLLSYNNFFLLLSFQSSWRETKLKHGNRL